MTKLPTYSIIIPTKEGMPYLKYACMSVLATDRADIELVVSVDWSKDSTDEFLESLTDPRLKVVRPQQGLTMSEHWDFAQQHASGEWQMFLGQDDMLINDYPMGLDSYTSKARDLGLEIIVARRAYICWPPLQHNNLMAIQYWKSDEIKVIDSQVFTDEALCSGISYHVGPQMYTSSLVAREVIQEIREGQQGRLIVGHPQDAYLSAALLKARKHYLWAGAPFSWVGTSMKSAGLAISQSHQSTEFRELASRYAEGVEKSISVVFSNGIDFRHGITSRYFFDAVLQTNPDSLRMRQPQLLTEIKRDSRIHAEFNREISSHNKSRELFTVRRLIHLKEILGVFIAFWDSLLRVSFSVAAPLLRGYLHRRRAYFGLKKVASQDQLFTIANQVNLSPPKPPLDRGTIPV